MRLRICRWADPNSAFIALQELIKLLNKEYFVITSNDHGIY